MSKWAEEMLAIGNGPPITNEEVEARLRAARDLPCHGFEPTNKKGLESNKWDDLQDHLLTLLDPPPAFTGLSLEFNNHRLCYESARDWWRGMEHDHECAKYEQADIESEWLSAEDLELALSTESVWSLQWYPRTPVGSSIVYASSLSRLIEVMQREGFEEEK